jgi:hypothetical protein
MEAEIFGSGSVGVGVGLGTLGDHVTFITAEQKTGGWTEGHPDSYIRASRFSLPDVNRNIRWTAGPLNH